MAQQAPTPVRETKDGAGTLVVTIFKAWNLKNVETFSANDPYVAIWMDSPTGRKMQKTTVKDNSRKPVWNETYRFDVMNSSKEGDLRFVIWDKNSYSKDKEVGVATMPMSELKSKGFHFKDTLKVKPQGSLDVEIVFSHNQVFHN